MIDPYRRCNKCGRGFHFCDGEGGGESNPGKSDGGSILTGHADEAPVNEPSSAPAAQPDPHSSGAQQQLRELEILKRADEIGAGFSQPDTRGETPDAPDAPGLRDARYTMRTAALYQDLQDAKALLDQLDQT